MWILVRSLALMLTGQLSIKYHMAKMVRKGYQPHQPSAQDKVVLFSSQLAIRTSLFHSATDPKWQSFHWQHKTNSESRLFLSLFWDEAHSTPFKAPDRYPWLSAPLKCISVSIYRLSNQWFSSIPVYLDLLPRITEMRLGIKKMMMSGLILEILIQSVKHKIGVSKNKQTKQKTQSLVILTCRQDWKIFHLHFEAEFKAEKTSVLFQNQAAEKQRRPQCFSKIRQLKRDRALILSQVFLTSSFFPHCPNIFSVPYGLKATKLEPRPQAPWIPVQWFSCYTTSTSTAFLDLDMLEWDSTATPLSLKYWIGCSRDYEINFL